MIKAVVFDMDDTLYPEREYLISGFNKIGKYIDNNYKLLGCAETLLKLYDENPVNVYERFLAVQKLDNADLKDIMINLYRDNKPTILHFFDDVMPLFDFLKSNNIKIGVITDGRVDGQQNKVDSLGLVKFADFIILTESLGGEEYRKPHPKAFKEMARTLNVEFNEMVFVGDNPIKDFAISNLLPITTVEILRKNKIHNCKEYREGILPNHTIKSLFDIIKIVIDKKE